MRPPRAQRDIKSQEQLPPPENENELFVHERLEVFQRNSAPVSRHHLAVLLGKNKTLSYRKASDIVNLYCDERAPAIPHYLGNEFMIPYLKMISLLPGALAVIVVIVTVVRFHSNVNAPGFLWGLILAGLLLTLGVLAYIRSLVREFSSED